MGPLGLDPLVAPVERISGMGSSNVPTHFANVTIDLQGLVQFPVYAGFTSGLDQTGVGLLGQTGFFERLKITFDYSKKMYSIEIP
jgi:hypothetical protein